MAAVLFQGADHDPFTPTLYPGPPAAQLQPADRADLSPSHHPLRPPFPAPPEQLGPEEIRLYQLSLLQRHASWSVFNQAVCALRFLYRFTLQAAFPVNMIPYGKKPRVLPAVLSQAEVAPAVDAGAPASDSTDLTDHLRLWPAHCSEVLGLRVTDIDSSRMLVWVRHGKGAKDRAVPLSPALLEALRGHWRRPGPRPGCSPARRRPGSAPWVLCNGSAAVPS